MKIILAILLIAILIIIITNQKNTNNKNNENKNNAESINYNTIYKPKRYVTTLTELKFYTILFEIARELDLILFSQVSLYNIVETKYNNQSAFNKIRSKAIDFVLVDKNTCRIKLCIELDDYTHNKTNRIERDKFVNKLFENLEIDLIRIKASNYYNKEELKKKIEENIHEHYYKD